MKKLVILLCALWIISCSEEEKNTNTNLQWTITFNENMTSDFPAAVNKTEKLLFDRGQLIQHSVRQTIMESEIYHETNLTHDENKVTVSTELTTLIYTLNTEGYAGQCTYTTPGQIRKYNFSYSIEGYLTEIAEYLNEELFSTTTLTYSDGDLQSITSNQYGISNKINYEPGESVSKYHLTCIGILEVHPFSMHTEAFYAGLLGKSPLHFTARTTPEGNDSEYTTYTYEFDKEGNPTLIKSQTTYTGGTSGSYYPNHRSVSISYSYN